jgi:hypothetical protein
MTRYAQYQFNWELASAKTGEAPAKCEKPVASALTSEVLPPAPATPRCWERSSPRARGRGGYRRTAATP